MNSQIQTIAQSRANECLVESRARELRLRPLRRANWFTVVLPALITGLACAGIMTGGSNSIWRYVAGGLTVIASLLVIIHKALNCDAYQAETHRLQQGYDALAARYRTIYEVDPADAEAKLLALDEKLAILKESARVTVPEHYRVSAQELVSGGIDSTASATSASET